MSSFPASVAYGYEAGTRVEEFDLTETNVIAGSLVYFDTGDATVKICGADPSLIAGIAEGGNNKAGYGPAAITPDGKVPVRLLNSDAVVALSSPTTLSEANRGVAYGIANNSGIWQLDTTDTSNTRCVVVRVDEDQQIAYVQFFAANLQFDAVAS